MSKTSEAAAKYSPEEIEKLERMQEKLAEYFEAAVEDYEGALHRKKDSWEANNAINNRRGQAAACATGFGIITKMLAEARKP